MIGYVEDMKIDSHTCGIEDCGQPFVQDRFRIWVGGCRVSPGEPTLEQAREMLYAYMTARLEREVKQIYREYKNREKALKRLRKHGKVGRKLEGKW